MKRKTTTLLGITTLALTAGVVIPANAVTRGKDAQRSAYPFSAKLSYADPHRGSPNPLVDPNWFITAAHCYRSVTDGGRPPTGTVIIGRSHASQKGQRGS